MTQHVHAGVSVSAGVVVVDANYANYSRYYFDTVV